MCLLEEQVVGGRGPLLGCLLSGVSDFGVSGFGLRVGGWGLRVEGFNI